jgi:hypothetical protein
VVAVIFITVVTCCALPTCACVATVVSPDDPLMFQCPELLFIYRDPPDCEAATRRAAELSKEVPRDGLRDHGDGGRRSVDWSLPPMHLADETLDAQVSRLAHQSERYG